MHTQSLNSIASKDLQALKNTRVFVVGDVILDSYIEGKVSRISPEAPAPVLLETQKKHVPGGAGNVAANIASIGAHVQICARIGNDTEAEILKGRLQDFGVDVSAMIVENNIPTTTKTRIVSHHEFALNAHQIVRMDRESCAPICEETHKQCIKAFKIFLEKEKKNSSLVISDYGKGFLTAALLEELINLSNSASIPIIVDPKHADVARYSNATVIKPNLSEGRSLFEQSAEQITSFVDFFDESQHIAQHYLAKSQCRNIVMSLSQHGVLVLGEATRHPQTNNLAPIHFSTKALQVSDVSGAGDTLVAFLAMALAANFPLSTATHLGNIAAGIVCGKMGTSVVHMDELFERIHTPRYQDSNEKIIKLKDLLSVIKDLRDKNQKFVFTNGCFDILHAGHVQYLQKAKEFGDLLIIGLNSDASVKRLKGESRPVQKFSDRAQILAALSCTDFIVEFDEDTPLELIRALKPDILVKGSDYDFETTVGAKDVVSWGGKVEHIALLPGRSTSIILKRN